MKMSACLWMIRLLPDLSQERLLTHEAINAHIFRAARAKNQVLLTTLARNHAK